MSSPSWVRRQFDAAGLTQSPPGPYLPALQEKYGVGGGTVLLCVDVSGSMHGTRLQLAKQGGAQFLREAVAAGYDCGLVLWSTAIDGYVVPEPSGDAAAAALHATGICGGTNLVPCLQLALQVFPGWEGDRVLCLFSDGEFPDYQRCQQLARELCAMGVRIIVRELGAGGLLAGLACPGCPDEQQIIEHEADIGTGIASMAAGLTVQRTS